MKLVSLASTLATATALVLTVDFFKEDLKFIEVYFYGKNSDEIKLKISLQDLNSTNKSKFYKDTAWQPISNSSENKKYFHLHEIASKFIKVQHYLNIVNMIKWNRKINFQSKPNNPTITCKCESCICKEQDISKIQTSFSYYLSNLKAPYSNSYLTPIQAHIKLSDTDLSTDLNSDSTSSKEMIGSLVYGWVDYKFKITNYSDDNFYSEISPDHNLEPDSSSSETTKKYYSNFPNKFKFQLGTSTTETTKESTDLDSLLKTLSSKTQILDKVLSNEQSTTEEIICCDDETKDITKKNWIYKEELSKIQDKVKNFSQCKSS